MIEVVLAILLGLSVLGNIVLIKGVKIEQNQTSVQTTVTEVHNENRNENINTVNVLSGRVSLTNRIEIVTNSSITNSYTNSSGKTNLLFK